MTSVSVNSTQTKIHEQARQLFLFDEVYPLSAAREQAEKKKLSAFGMLAKLNPLKRPTSETVLLRRDEMRLEPFWHISALRSVNYESTLFYPVPVNNQHALGVSLGGNRHEITRTGDKARIEIEVTEHCHRKIEFNQLIDGMGRDIKPKTLANYCQKYKYQSVDALDRPEIVRPILAREAAQQKACSELLGRAINASVISEDNIEFDKIYLFLRPVFAFEYVWASADRTGVVEVDGLTGEVSDDGRWFKDKLDRVLTREMLIEASAEVAGAMVPGGALAVKLVDRMTD